MQYLVPLNNDEPFKKIFSDKEIAKAFLEDLLGIIIETIETIQWMETDNKISNAASLVRFDFRCQIEGQEVIIEMQQDYFDYLIKRFYLYHCLNTGLQLERIKDRTEKNELGREVVIKRYAELKPVITIIWMSETNLGFDDDFVEFNTYPKPWADFIKNDAVWIQEKDEIVALRSQLLKHLDQEKDYGLGFHEQNRLIYVFQNNIVKNKKDSPYFKWFEFAHKTRKKNNKRDDFQQFINNKIFSTMIQRLCTTYMEPDELRKMIGDEAYFAAKALEELDRENDRLAKLKNAYLMEFGHEIREERAAARMKFFKAYENWSIEKRALLKENAQLQQAHEQELEKAREAEKNKQLLIAEKEKQKVLLKSEKEKQKVLLRGKEKQEKLLNLLKEKEKQELLLKAEKEKQELLLKAEKEKQELLKAEKEKQELFQFKMVQTMLKLGNSVEMIADLLEISVAQVQDWSKDFKK